MLEEALGKMPESASDAAEPSIYRDESYWAYSEGLEM